MRKELCFYLNGRENMLKSRKTLNKSCESQEHTLTDTKDLLPRYQYKFTKCIKCNIIMLTSTLNKIKSQGRRCDEQVFFVIISCQLFCVICLSNFYCI